MAMFFDILFENKEDAQLIAKHLPLYSNDCAQVTGDDQVLLDDATHPVIVHDRKLLERSKLINQKRVFHPVNYAFHLSVRDLLAEQANEFIFELLSSCIAQMTGCISLISYGDSLLFRKIDNTICLYNTDFFWDERKVQTLRSKTHFEFTVSAEKHFVE